MSLNILYHCLLSIRLSPERRIDGLFKVLRDFKSALDEYYISKGIFKITSGPYIIDVATFLSVHAGAGNLTIIKMFEAKLAQFIKILDKAIDEKIALSNKKNNAIDKQVQKF